MTGSAPESWPHAEVGNEPNEVEDEDDTQRNEHFVEEMAKVLLGVADKVGDESMSSLLSVLYFVSLDMAEMKAHKPGPGYSTKTFKPQEVESIVENRFVNAEYRFDGTESGGAYIAF